MTRLYQILCLLMIVVLSSTCIGAQPPKPNSEVWSGYLVDIVCAQERAKTEKDFGVNHTRRCLQMPSCDRGGFGLLTDQNQVLRFDDEGNQKARTLIMKTNQQADFRVLVHGVRSEGALSISKIELVPDRRQK